MAIINELLVGRYNRYVQKLFSMKGPAALSQVAGELQMAINFQSGVEVRNLEGWDLFQREFNTTLFAGAFSSAAIRNPVGSNVVAVVTKAFISPQLIDGGPSLVYYPPGAPGALLNDATVVTAIGLDPRGRPSSTCIVSHNPGGAGAGRTGGLVLMTPGILAGTTFEYLQGAELPLLPGSVLQILAGVVNQTERQSFAWRERYLEESERA